MSQRWFSMKSKASEVDLFEFPHVRDYKEVSRAGEMETLKRRRIALFI